MEFMHHERWEDALFLHYEADPIALQALLPPDLAVDTHEGKAYVGVVALSELGITPTFLPQWLRRLLALSHHAVNVRTYTRSTDGEDKPGIYFFTLDCSHTLPALGARLLFRLPYRLAAMTRRVLQNGKTFIFKSSRHITNAKLDVEWETKGEAVPAPPDSLAFFFVERYCLYNRAGTFLRLFGIKGLWRGSITHAPWHVQKAQVNRLHNTVFSEGIQEAIFAPQNPIAHFSPGVSNVRFYFDAIPGHKSKGC
jgi:uncharacterized protein YqjF (DUF2071 family)